MYYNTPFTFSKGFFASQRRMFESGLVDCQRSDVSRAQLAPTE